MVTMSSRDVYFLQVSTQSYEIFKPWDNPDNVITYKTFQKIIFLVECGIQPCLFFVGAPGNLLSALVFVRQGLKDRMNLLLFALAVVDLLFVTVVFLSRGPYCFVDESNHGLKEFLRWNIRKWLLNFLFGFMYSSGWLTAVISVERCMCVILPMKAATLVKTKTIVFLVVSIVLVVNVLCSVYAIMHRVVSVKDAESGEWKLVLGYSDLYMDHQTLIDTVDYFVLPAMTFVTFLIVSVSTVLTVANLKRAIAWRQNISNVNSGDGRQVALVKMLVAVSCIYIACTAPTLALTLTRLLVDDFWTTGRYRNIFYASYQIAYAFLLLNSSVNFFVYLGRSSRFQQELRSLGRRRPRKQLSEASSLTLT